MFALNFGQPSDSILPALTGLVNAGTHIPGNPVQPGDPYRVSPVFYGLENFARPPTF